MLVIESEKSMCYLSAKCCWSLYKEQCCLSFGFKLKIRLLSSLEITVHKDVKTFEPRRASQSKEQRVSWKRGVGELRVSECHLVGLMWDLIGWRLGRVWRQTIISSKNIWHWIWFYINELVSLNSQGKSVPKHTIKLRSHAPQSSALSSEYYFPL